MVLTSFSIKILGNPVQGFESIDSVARYLHFFGFKSPSSHPFPITDYLPYLHLFYLCSFHFTLELFYPLNIQALYQNNYFLVSVNSCIFKSSHSSMSQTLLQSLLFKSVSITPGGGMSSDGFLLVLFNVHRLHS